MDETPIHAGIISLRFNPAGTDLQFLIVENYEGKVARGFPAGKGQLGEDPEKAARREAQEETNLEFVRTVELIFSDDGEADDIRFKAYFFVHWEKKSEPREPSIPESEKGKIKWVGWLNGTDFWKVSLKRRHEKARKKLLEYLELKFEQTQDPRLWSALQIAKAA
jgi:8-oxo-dGTP pyrophosphatase MutT (NUDIX family)